MIRRPSVSATLAMKAAAAAAAARDDEPEEPVPIEVPEGPPASAAPAGASDPEPEPQEVAGQAQVKAIGRPKGRRPVAARQTVYLDDARHAALARIAEDRGRSIHSLILEGIDHVIGKPTTPGWR